MAHAPPSADVAPRTAQAASSAHRHCQSGTGCDPRDRDTELRARLHRHRHCEATVAARGRQHLRGLRAPRRTPSYCGMSPRFLSLISENIICTDPHVPCRAVYINRRCYLRKVPPAWLSSWEHRSGSSPGSGFLVSVVVLRVVALTHSAGRTQRYHRHAVAARAACLTVLPLEPTPSHHPINGHVVLCGTLAGLLAAPAI